MKTRSTILYSAMVLMMAGACSDHDETLEEVPLQPQELTEFRVVAPSFKMEDGLDSRLAVDVAAGGITVKWNGCDTLGIMPSEGAQAPFPINIAGQDPTSTANFTGGGWALRPSATYSAYYPYIGDIYLDRSSIPVNYEGQWQNSMTDDSYLAPYIYMAANAVAPKEGVANFALKHVGCYVLFELNTTEPTAFSSIKLMMDEPLFVKSGKLNMSIPSLDLVSKEMSDTLLFRAEGVQTTAEQQQVTFCYMFAPTNLEGKTITAIVRDTDGYEETVKFVGKKMEAGCAYKYDNLSYVEYTKHGQPGWKYDEVSNPYQSGMTTVVTVPKSMQKFVGEGDEMSAYIGGQLRGVGQLINGAFYLMVHGDIGEVGKVSFKYYNKKKQYLYEANDVVEFNSDKVFGVSDEPERLPLLLVK